MEITNRTGIEKTVLNGSLFLIYRPSSILSYRPRVTPYPFPTFYAQHDVSFELPGGNGRDSGIAGWENMGMGFVSDGNGNEVIEMGGNWYEKSIHAHL